MPCAMMLTIGVQTLLEKGGQRCQTHFIALTTKHVQNMLHFGALVDEGLTQINWNQSRLLRFIATKSQVKPDIALNMVLSIV